MSTIYARPSIHAIGGYTPGEQPRGRKLIKLNTNENPYPPSPKVQAALAAFDVTSLRLYPDPTGIGVRQAAAEIFNLPVESVICGNGSDDLLTIALRTFVDAGDAFAYPDPSYSLYPVLADLQGARKVEIPLTDDFGLPENAAQLAAGARLFILARPNAPTGNAFPKEQIRQLCADFAGVVWIDEAYADFAQDSCIDLVQEFPNVVVSRTFSKSYALAGLRLGLAFAQPELIAEMMKVKDSYNIDRLTQEIGEAALRDQEYLHAITAKVVTTRQRSIQRLCAMGCRVLPSEANFIFVQPAHTPAAELFARLRDEGFLVRYFPLPRISQFLRISIGTDEEMEALLQIFEKLDQ